jgi:subtilisin family serine protease
MLRERERGLSQNDFLKMCRSWVFLLLALSLSGCGIDPFSSMIAKQLQNNQGASPDPNTVCPQALAAGPLSVRSASVPRKVRLGNHRFETEALGLSQMVRAGTKLVATYDGQCLGGKGPALNAQSFVLDRDRDVQDLEVEAQSDPCLIKVTENFTYHINATSNDPRLSQQKHLDAIRAFDGYDAFYNASTGVQKTMVIAVVDSGVDIDHEDLKNNIWHNPHEIADNKIDDDKNGFVDDVEGWNFAAHGNQAPNDPRPLTWTDDPGDEVHGTHVAGLAAAAWNNAVGGAGVMGRNVQIMAINVFGDSSAGDTAALNNGIRYAADNGADIINLSLGACGYDETTLDAILYAICRGSTVVVAAGNTFYYSGSTLIGRELSDDPADENNSCDTVNLPSSGRKKYFQTPSSFGASVNGLITVGATDAVPNSSGQYSVSDFSGWSATLVEIGAPGSQSGTDGLVSTLPDDHYGREEGTSMSTPLVAGAAALAKSYAARKGVSLTPMNLERLLEDGGRHEPLLDGKVKNGMHLDLVNLAHQIDANINSYR